MMRSIGAIAAGLAVNFALVFATTSLATLVFGVPIAGPATNGYLGLNLLGAAVAGAAGGATAVAIAAHAPHGHVLALALAILLVSLPALFAAPPPGQPAWYPLVLSVLGPVSVVAGGWLAIGRQRRSV